MVHRIVITGAESTGKTTLARALAERYGEPWTKEFVRDYVDRLGHTLQQTNLEPIAQGQFALEDKGLKQAQRLVFHDTNILSSIIYAKHYFGTTLDWVDKRFQERTYNLYLLCMPDIPWETDGKQRESPKARAQLHKIFKAKLDSLQLPYIEIGGSKEKRLKRAVEALGKLIEL